MYYDCPDWRAGNGEITPRQREIICHVITGKSEKQIAIDLHISVSCIRKQLHRAGHKLGASGGRANIVAVAIARDIITLTEVRQLVCCQKMSQIDN